MIKRLTCYQPWRKLKRCVHVPPTCYFERLGHRLRFPLGTTGRSPLDHVLHKSYSQPENKTAEKILSNTTGKVCQGAGWTAISIEIRLRCNEMTQIGNLNRQSLEFMSKRWEHSIGIGGGDRGRLPPDKFFLSPNTSLLFTCMPKYKALFVCSFVHRQHCPGIHYSRAFLQGMSLQTFSISLDSNFACSLEIVPSKISHCDQRIRIKTLLTPLTDPPPHPNSTLTVKRNRIN